MLYSSIEKLSLGVFLVLLLWQAHPALMPQKVIKVHFHNILLLRFVTKKDEPIAALLLVLQQIMFSKKIETNSELFVTSVSALSCFCAWRLARDEEGGG